MREYLPLLIAGAVIGVFTVFFLVAYGILKCKVRQPAHERNMSDRYLIGRLMHYAKPYTGKFVLVFIIMLVSIAYDVVSPLILSRVQGMIKVPGFQLKSLYSMVAVYAGILVVSMVCTYFQAMILQEVGQKILTQIRLDTFTRIESLSHEQLNQIPVGKLVTRVSNDPNSISYLFTNVLVTLLKNTMVIIGVLGAMLVLNYALTLMVLCFVPFLTLFTVIFQRFSREVHRRVNNTRTDVNTYLSENLSGMKITQVFNREDVKKARLVANPGCYPTSSILGLYPALSRGLISPDDIVIDSKSGTTGSGRKPKVGSLFCEVYDTFKAYGLGTHRHTPEIEQELSLIAKRPVTLSFNTHLVPMNRGILSTIYTKPTDPKTTIDDVHKVYEAAYANARWVRVLPAGKLPETRYVRGSMFCDLGLVVDPRTGRLIIVSAIDNICRGASGQALANANLMCGLPVEEGLDAAPLLP